MNNCPVVKQHARDSRIGCQWTTNQNSTKQIQTISFWECFSMCLIIKSPLLLVATIDGITNLSQSQTANPACAPGRSGEVHNLMPGSGPKLLASDQPPMSQQMHDVIWPLKLGYQRIRQIHYYVVYVYNICMHACMHVCICNTYIYIFIYIEQDVAKNTAFPETWKMRTWQRSFLYIYIYIYAQL